MKSQSGRTCKKEGDSQPDTAMQPSERQGHLQDCSMCMCKYGRGFFVLIRVCSSVVTYAYYSIGTSKLRQLCKDFTSCIAPITQGPSCVRWQ